MFERARSPATHAALKRTKAIRSSVGSGDEAKHVFNPASFGDKMDKIQKRHAANAFDETGLATHLRVHRAKPLRQ